MHTKAIRERGPVVTYVLIGVVVIYPGVALSIHQNIEEAV